MEAAAPRGTQDILPESAEWWQQVETAAREVARRFNFKEIRTPIFEHTEVFARGVGETTDIVEKEMYTFMDKGGRSLTLRPEGTAGVVRAYVEHKLYGVSPLQKLYYIGPAFRYERPQAGRYRQHHQFGLELIGSVDPAADTEIIGLTIAFYRQFGLKDLEVRLNSIGCPSCRPVFREALINNLKSRKAALCTTCNERLERNPLRLLDCKNPDCQSQMQDLPKTVDFLCPECREHFDKVRCYLELKGIKYVLDATLVRGLDYYTRTVFEIVYRGLGAQDAMCGGGRYDGLIEILGGPPTPGVGVGIGLERLILTLEKQQVYQPQIKPLDVFIIACGEKERDHAVELAYRLRSYGLSVDFDFQGRAMKAQLKAADRSGAIAAVIIGEEELRNEAVIVKIMQDGTQQNVPLIDIETALTSIIMGQKTARRGNNG